MESNNVNSIRVTFNCQIFKNTKEDKDIKYKVQKMLLKNVTITLQHFVYTLFEKI